MMTTQTIFRKVPVATVVAMKNVPGFTVRQYKLKLGDNENSFHLTASYFDEFSQITYSSEVVDQQVNGVEIAEEL